MIRLIVSDLDGTLLGPSGKVDPDFFQLLPQLRQRDILFLVATGRQIMSAKECFTDAGELLEEIIFITQNGSHVRQGERTLENQPLPPGLVCAVVEKARQLTGVLPILFTNTYGYIPPIDGEMERKLLSASVYCHQVDDLMEIARTREIVRVTMRDEIGAATNSYPALSAAFGDAATVSMASPRWMDIVGKNVDKGQALAIIQQELGISVEETVVFGDYYNDLPMLRCAHHSFAMGNACDAVVEAAAYQCASNGDNGVVMALRGLIFGDEAGRNSYKSLLKMEATS